MKFFKRAKQRAQAVDTEALRQTATSTFSAVTGASRAAGRRAGKEVRSRFPRKADRAASHATGPSDTSAAFASPTPPQQSRWRPKRSTQVQAAANRSATTVGASPLAGQTYPAASPFATYPATDPYAMTSPVERRHWIRRHKKATAGLVLLALLLVGCLASEDPDEEEPAKPRGVMAQPAEEKTVPAEATREEVWAEAAEENRAQIFVALGAEEDDEAFLTLAVASAVTACTALSNGDELDERLAVTSDLLPAQATPTVRRSAVGALIDAACPDLSKAHSDQVTEVEAVEAAEAEKAAAAKKARAEKKAAKRAAKKAAAARREAERIAAEKAEEKRIRGLVNTSPGGGGTDPNYGTCGDANAAGRGNYVSGVDPEYDWYQDRDGDGIVCEF